jgi:putative tryptophan/tyrosine transport system substrate-binding protein
MPCRNSVRRPLDHSCGPFLPTPPCSLGPQRAPNQIGNGPIFATGPLLKPLAQRIVQPNTHRFQLRFVTHARTVQSSEWPRNAPVWDLQPEASDREFITLLGGAAAAWPLAARAQQGERMRRIGVLMNTAADDPEGKVRNAAFERELQELGWTDGRNVRIDYRWGAGDADRIRRYAAELVSLSPDVILTVGSATAGPLLQATRTVPIVFVQAPDPVGAGFVDSLARPGGNATGFTLFEYGISGKWLELLKEIAPRVTRVAVLRDPAIAAGTGQLGAIQSAAPSFGVELSPLGVRDPGEIERAITAFARSSNGGLIVTVSTLAGVHRDLIVTLAARYKLPAVYYARYIVAGGGLISYGPDFVDQHRRAAGYVDRILKGEKPADLPVQTPTKYELAINLKTAKALGLDIPASVLARADEVIE